ARAFVVPALPVQPPVRIAAARPVGERTMSEDQKLQVLLSRRRDSVSLVPPADDVVFGLWRAEALVIGDSISKVVFSVDGTPQYARNSAAYTVELRLKRL